MRPIALNVLNEQYICPNKTWSWVWMCFCHVCFIYAFALQGYTEPTAAIYWRGHKVLFLNKLTYRTVPRKLRDKHVISCYTSKTPGSESPFISLRRDKDCSDRFILTVWFQSRTIIPDKSIICCWPAAIRGNGALRNQSGSIWSSWRSRHWGDKYLYCYTPAPWDHTALLLRLNTDWMIVT